MITASSRAALRVARRSARRDWKRTLFVVALIAMPVAVAIVVAGITRANQIAPETEVASRFGSATLRVEGYAMKSGELARSIDDAVVPGTPSQSFRSIWMGVGGSDSALVEDLDIGHPLAAGILNLVEGTAPGADGEVAMSASLADRLGVGAGDKASFALAGTDRRLTVTGIVADPANYQSGRLLFTPKGFDAILYPGAVAETSAVTLVDASSPDQSAQTINTVEERRWEEIIAAFPPELTEMVGTDVLSAFTAEEIEELAELARTVSPEELTPAVSDLLGGRVPVSTGSLWAESRTEALASYGSESVLSTPSVVGTLVGALLLAEVALVAGAAYATGTRRRLREIGLLTSNGATDRHVRLIVIGEGLVAGVIGAAIGIGLALVGLSLGTPILQGSARKLLEGPLVSVVDIAAPALAGIAAATVAAWLPARTASRVATITALQGRMPVSPPPRWIVPLGVGLTGLGTFLLVVARTALGNEAVAQAGLGVVLMIGGFVLLAGPMVAGAGHFADRFRATWRLVLRDSARQRTRAAAAVAAMMVVLIAPVIAGASLVTGEQRDLIYGLPQPGNQVVVNRYDVVGVIADVNDQDVSRVLAVLPDAVVARFNTVAVSAMLATQGLSDGIVPSDLEPMQVAVGTAELAAALDTPAIAEHLAAGTPVVLGIEDRPTSATLDGRSFPARELRVPITWAMPKLLIPPTMAAEQDWSLTGSQALFVVDGNVPDDKANELWNLDGLSANLTDTGLLSSSGFMLVGLAGTLLVMLIITALVTALAAAESDRDLAVMTAVGAPPSMRRRFLGLQTAFYATFAAALAIPLGLLLLKVTSGGQTYTAVGPFGAAPGDTLVVPWAIIGLLAVVFPPVIGGLTALAVRSSPTLPRQVG